MNSAISNLEARHALTACRILRAVGAFGLMLLALNIFSWPGGMGWELRVGFQLGG